jgi:5'-3' exonuclease
MKKDLIIIDGNNLVHRCYHVAEQMNPTGMEGLLHVHMVLSAIKSYKERYNAKKIVCCWDLREEGVDNHRNSLLPEYKAQRDKDKAREVHCETDFIIELINCLGIANIYPKKLEADDIMAWFCHTHPGEKVVISSDKDMLQLVTKDVVFFDPMKKVEINLANFNQNSKLKYDTFLVEKCFAGDKSDNVPGVYGFGPVKVKKYLNGEVELTDEQKDQLKLNEEVFRLDMYNDVPGEIEHYKSQSQTAKVRWDDFLALCEKRSLKSIIKNKESWYNMFAMDMKLTNMFENLFG